VHVDLSYNALPDLAAQAVAGLMKVGRVARVHGQSFILHCGQLKNKLGTMLVLLILFAYSLCWIGQRSAVKTSFLV
jgi:hypothetical protein